MIIVSPKKLFKQDRKTAMRPVTWGPRGNPYKSRSAASKNNTGTNGSLCSRHAHVDSFVHRWVPMQSTVLRKSGHPHLSNAMDRTAMVGANVKRNSWAGQHIKEHLLATSPRHGPGIAPSRRARQIAPLPDLKKVMVSNKTKHQMKVRAGVGVGVAAAGVAGYEAYKHRAQIKHAASDIDQKFHHSRFYHTMHSSHAPGVA